MSKTGDNVKINYTPLSQKLLNEVKDKTPLKDSKGRFINGVAQDTNKNGDSGRPTKYQDKFVQEADKYLAKAKFPSVEGFALHLRVDDTTLLNWANKRLKDENGNLTKKLARPDFFAAIKRIKIMQKEQLMRDGMYGGKEVNATMAIFLLKANHGMVDTTNIDHTTKGQPMEVKVVSYQDLVNNGQ